MLESNYTPDEIVDAPEHHERARAFGLLTWDVWSSEARSFEGRKADFVSAFPPEDPTRFVTARSLGGRRQEASEPLLKRFLADDWRPGSLHELLSRYGLKLQNGPTASIRAFSPAPFLESARRRNAKLRVLHGGVDIEAKDMTAAKAEVLERQEKVRAAQDVREARKRMAAELARDKDM